MTGEYTSDVESFFAHDDVNANESWAGLSFPMAAGLLALTAGAVLWWRHRTA